MKSKKIDKKNIVFVLFIILIISLIVFRRYIYEPYYLFNNRMLSDIVRANVPTYYHMFDAIEKGGYFWSWQMGVGTSMFSHADSYFDPFVYIVFIFGKEHILDMLVWMFITKLICEGIAFYLYISYFGIDNKAAIFASVIYAFSGYSMIVGSNFALGTILVYLPLILLGAEKYIFEGKKGLLIILLYATCIMSYYYFYITAIGLCVYTFYRMIYSHKFSWKKIGGFLIVGLLVIGSSMFILLPQIELVLQSSRVTGKSDVMGGISLFIPSVKTLFTAIIRGASNDALGNGYTSQYMGEAFSARDYFGEAAFAGSLFYYFIFVLIKESKEKNKTYLHIILGIVLCIMFPIVSYVGNAFSTINVRWMYWITLLQCVGISFAANKIIKEKKIYWETYWISLMFYLIVSFIGIIIISIGDQYPLNLAMLCNTLVEQLLYIFIIYIGFAIMLFIIKKIQLKVQLSNKVSDVLVIFCVGIIILGFDICYNYYWWYESEYAVSEYTEANDLNFEDTSAAIISELIPKTNEFYRINKSFDSVVTSTIPSENDAMVQGYYGLKNYNSLGNMSYIDFLQASGCYCTIPAVIEQYKENGIKPEQIHGQELNYIHGVENRYNLMSYLGVKYYLSKISEEEVPQYFRVIAEKNGITVYENEYNMPLLFCNKNNISEQEFRSLSDSEKDIALLSCTILPDGTENYNRKKMATTLEEALKNVKKNQTRFEINKFTNDQIIAEIEIPIGCEYVSTTIPYDENWKVCVDGGLVDTEKINIGFIGFHAPEGFHTIELKYDLKSFKVGCTLSFFSLMLLIILIFINYKGIVGKYKNKQSITIS